MSHQQSPWSLRIPCLSRNLSVQEVDKIKAFGLNAWVKVKEVSNTVKEKSVPVVLSAAIGTAYGACTVLEVVANVTADMHDALHHKVLVFESIHCKVLDSEGQVL